MSAKDQSWWALSEYEGRIWKLSTLPRLESIWNQWTVASPHIFNVSIPQILSQKILFNSPFTFDQQGFGFNSKNICQDFFVVFCLLVFFVPDIFEKCIFFCVHFAFNLDLVNVWAEPTWPILEHQSSYTWKCKKEQFQKKRCALKN